MGTSSESTRRLSAVALVAFASVALGASLAFGSPTQTEDNPNYPIFPPRETLAFSD